LHRADEDGKERKGKLSDKAFNKLRVCVVAMFPEHRQRSRYGNTHVDCRTGVRSPSPAQFAVQQRVIVDVHGLARLGTSDGGKRNTRPTSESVPGERVKKLQMIYDLRAATPDLPYDPYTLRPEAISRSCTATPDELSRQRASRGGLWSPAGGHRNMLPPSRQSWKVHTRVGPLCESPNSIPALRSLHCATPHPVLGEGLRD